MKAATQQGRRLGFEARAAFLCVALLLAVTAADAAFRQGLAAAWDEVAVQGLLQSAREGASLPLGLSRASLYLRGLAALLWLPGFQAAWLHAPVLLGLILEAALLWTLARRLGGRSAAAVAVAVHCASRLTWYRAFTVLGFSLAPLWALSAWFLALQARGRWQALAAGLVSGLLLGDYEAGLAALPGLAWICLRRQRRGDPAGAAFGLGLLLGLGLLAALLPADFARHYAQVRGLNLRSAQHGPLRELWINAVAFFTGLGKPLESGWGAALALPALPLLAHGLRRLPGEAWLFLVAGLALLAAPSPGAVEAHRAAVAWPALCIAAGLGAQPLFRARRSDRAPLGLVALLLLIAAWAAADRAGFMAQRQAGERDRYEYSWRLQRAAQRLRGLPVNSELNFRSMGAFRLRLGPVPSGMPVWSLLSGEQVGPVPPARWGRWHPIQVDPQAGTLWLLQAPSEDAALWQARDQAVAQWLRQLEPLSWSAQLGRIEQALRGGEVQDPFLRSLLLDRALWAAKDVGLPGSLARWALQQPELSPRQCLALAVALERDAPGQALALVERALKADPKRLGALRLRDELLHRLGR